MCKKDFCKRVLIETLFITVRNWKEPNSQKEDWLNKLYYSQTMGYSAIIKNNPI